MSSLPKTLEDELMKLDLAYIKENMSGTEIISHLTGVFTISFNIYECVIFQNEIPSIVWVDMEMKQIYLGCFKDLCEKTSKYRPYSPHAKELQMNYVLSTVQRKDPYGSKSLMKIDKTVKKVGSQTSLCIHAAEFIPWSSKINDTSCV